MTETNTVPFVLLGIIGIIGACQGILIAWWMVQNVLVDWKQPIPTGKKTTMTTLAAIASLAFWTGMGIALISGGIVIICAGAYLYRTW